MQKKISEKQKKVCVCLFMHGMWFLCTIRFFLQLFCVCVCGPQSHFGFATHTCVGTEDEPGCRSSGRLAGSLVRPEEVACGGGARAAAAPYTTRWRVGGATLVPLDALRMYTWNTQNTAATTPPIHKIPVAVDTARIGHRMPQGARMVVPLQTPMASGFAVPSGTPKQSAHVELSPKHTPQKSFSLLHTMPVVPLQQTPQSSSTAFPFGTSLQSKHVEFVPLHTPQASIVALQILPVVPAQQIPQESRMAVPLITPAQSRQVVLSPPHIPHWSLPALQPIVVLPPQQIPQIFSVAFPFGTPAQSWQVMFRPKQTPHTSLSLLHTTPVVPLQHTPQSSSTAVPLGVPLQSKHVSLFPPHIPQASVLAGPLGTPLQSSHVVPLPKQTPHISFSPLMGFPELPPVQLPQSSMIAPPKHSPVQSSPSSNGSEVFPPTHKLQLLINAVPLQTSAQSGSSGPLGTPLQSAQVLFVPLQTPQASITLLHSTPVVPLQQIPQLSRTAVPPMLRHTPAQSVPVVFGNPAGIQNPQSFSEAHAIVVFPPQHWSLQSQVAFPLGTPAQSSPGSAVHCARTVVGAPESMSMDTDKTHVHHHQAHPSRYHTCGGIIEKQKKNKNKKSFVYAFFSFVTTAAVYKNRGIVSMTAFISFRPKKNSYRSERSLRF